MSSKHMKHVLTWLRLSHQSVAILLAAMIGIFSAFGAGLIRIGVPWARENFIQSTSSFMKTELILFLFPLFGALATYIFRKMIDKELRDGQGIAEVMVSVQEGRGRIPSKDLFINTMGSMISLIAGLPVGSVGPTIFLTAGLGSLFSTFTHVSPMKARTYLSCGAAAGISALFNAPIGGMIFALEMILGEYRSGYFSLIIVSSFSASLTSRWLFGNVPVFTVPPYTMYSMWEILFYALLGILGAFLGLFHSHVFHNFQKYWRFTHLPQKLILFVSALFVSFFGLLTPLIYGGGFPAIEKALMGQLSLTLMLSLLFLQLIGNSMVLSAGFFGGIFAPILFTGAMLGGSFGMMMQLFFPTIVSQPGAYALVGMGAALAATGRAPMTAIVLLFEMTNDYRMILPLMITTVISFSLRDVFDEYSIFTMKLRHHSKYKWVAVRKYH
ncbi:chloride channel protein [Microaerobacter geothermalis]|uniref:chloride channel protein n=1 Tax=Microaerobacter geothermalis TaxID=674972 RepID=UPI001F2C730C|nr:chloride channel protein [Microaerobacter geothermalis]MCF6093658.1 chloride channel protein [Microaerobacter geothermalis]